MSDVSIHPSIGHSVSSTLHSIHDLAQCPPLRQLARTFLLPSSKQPSPSPMTAQPPPSSRSLASPPPPRPPFRPLRTHPSPAPLPFPPRPLVWVPLTLQHAKEHNDTELMERTMQVLRRNSLPLQPGTADIVFNICYNAERWALLSKYAARFVRSGSSCIVPHLTFSWNLLSKLVLAAACFRLMPSSPIQFLVQRSYTGKVQRSYKGKGPSGNVGEARGQLNNSPLLCNHCPKIGLPCFCEQSIVTCLADM